MVDKAIAYESSSGEWTGRALVAADDADDGGNFPADSDAVAAVLPAEYTVEKAYLSELPLATARERLIGGINSGTTFVSYLGHGGLDRLAQEGLLKTSDVASLGNADKLPVVGAFTCVAGQFAIPGYRSLGETLVAKQGGGAIALWGPTGFSDNSQARRLAEVFVQEAYASGSGVLGDAVVTARRLIRNDAALAETAKVYNLLGDPALRVRRSP
jgi:hypothetical protein